jgi:hypothetical protein
MFSYLSKEVKLGLRLPPVERETSLKNYRAKLCSGIYRYQLALRRFSQVEITHREGKRSVNGKYRSNNIPGRKTRLSYMLRYPPCDV